MNIVYKFYCRTFQFGLRTALPFLPYKDPKILNDIKDIPSVLKENSRILIVTDKNVVSVGLIDKLTIILDEKKIPYVVFDDILTNPTTLMVSNGLKVYKNFNANCIIAFGGGSPMDTAKAIGALIAKPKKELNKLKGILKIRKKIPFLIAIPTTAGTGSETTLAAVITDDVTRDKYAISDFPLIPSVAVLDYTTINSLPKDLIASTGMDALTHAIEAYIGRSTNKSTRKDALKAIELIFDNLTNCYKTEDKEAKINMMYASHYAGRAFSKSYVGNVHAMAHSLGGEYNYPHGLANAVLLTTVLDEYGKSIYKKMKNIAVHIGLCSKKEDSTLAFKLVMEKIILLKKELNIPNKIYEIKDEDIKELSIHAYKEANPLYPVPVIWSVKKFSEVFNKVKGENL